MAAALRPLTSLFNRSSSQHEERSWCGFSSSPPLHESGSFRTQSGRIILTGALSKRCLKSSTTLKIALNASSRSRSTRIRNAVSAHTADDHENTRRAPGAVQEEADTLSRSPGVGAVSRRTVLGSAALSAAAAASIAFPTDPALSLAQTPSPADSASLVASLSSQSSFPDADDAKLPAVGQLASLPALPPGSTASLAILGNCGLGVSVYPDFVYDPLGGGGMATAEDTGDGRIKVKFDPKTLFIPAVEGGTTKLLGVPLPPPIRIDIVPQALEGYIDRATGQADLSFKAKFYFSTGPLYRPAPLLVDTVLTTEFSKGEARSGQGARLDAEGKCLLVGTARVPPIRDAFLDNFLMLPADVLAVLPAQFTFTPATGTQPAPDKSDDSIETARRNGQYDLVHRLMVEGG